MNMNMKGLFLTGILLVMIFSLIPSLAFAHPHQGQIMINNNWIELEYIGYIIPGLIASWMDRQGVIRTVSVILIVASIVNLFMMYLYYIDQYRILYV